MLESSREIRGTHCYVKGNQGSQLTLWNDLAFDNVEFYRGSVAAVVGSSDMARSLTPVGLLATAATSQIVTLRIPWNAVIACLNIPIQGYTMTWKGTLADGTECQVKDNGTRYRALLFNNASKKRQEWIGFGIVMADDAETQGMFEALLREKGIRIEDEPKQS